MKIDLYTKTVLTIIAISLVLLVFKSTPPLPLVTSANATEGNEPVMKVNIVAINSRSIREGSWALPVQVENYGPTAVPVTIVK